MIIQLRKPMNKRIGFLLLLLVAAQLTSAQGELFTRATTSDTLKNRGEHEVGWFRAHALDNWVLNLQAGTNIYYGYEDNIVPIGQRFGSNFEMHLGHWIFPMVGLRLDMGFAKSHGFISKDSYLRNRGMLTADYGNCEGSSTSNINLGDTVVHGALGGYYWTDPDNADVLRQDWRYIYLGLDAMVNLSYLQKYERIDEHMRWHHLVYAGFQVRAGLSENNREKANSNAIGYSADLGRFHNTNFAAEAHVGYMPQYAFAKHFRVYADVRLSILEGNFDRERLNGVEKMGPDLNFNLSLGLSYGFNLRSDNARHRWLVERQVIPYNATDMPEFVTYVQVEDINYVRILDTIKHLTYDTIDDIVTLTYVDSLQGVLDSLINRANNLPDDTPLDSILLKQLLPYEMVFFDLDKWDIRATEEMKIAKMARLMKAYPERTFSLYGSADSHTGTVKRNDFLSHMRADVVFNKLVIDYDIPEQQMKREYLGGIDDYDPFILNRTTVIIMDHPAVRKAFNEMRSQRRAGGNVGEVTD